MIDLPKNNQKRPPKRPFRQKRSISQQTKHLQQEMGNFCVKRIIVKAGIPPPLSEETVCRVLQKAGCKQSRVQRRGNLTNNHLKMRLKFAQKICCKLSPNF